MVDEEDVVLESVPPQEQRRKKRQPAREPAEQTERKRRLASHVESHVGESLSRHHLESHVGSQPTRRESSPGAVGEMVALQRGSTKAPPILGLLKSRQGIRQAILVNEVLSKPKALRDED